jgi:hypothetical protein
MARSDDFRLPPILLVFYTPEFKETDYTLELAGPFELTTPIDAFQKQAGVKGCVVVLQASLVPADVFYGIPEPESPGESDEQPQP